MPGVPRRARMARAASSIACLPARARGLRRRLASCAALLTLVLNLTGCGLFGVREAPIEERTPSPIEPLEIGEVVPPRDESAVLRERLYAQFRVWKGAPYQNGGMSRRGIDCSGFVLVTYKTMLGLELPRTADEQATLGIPVGRDELATGDLVFFKTGVSTRHVGIYLDQGRFMHASRRRGVMISALNNGYWQRHWWQARRVPRSTGPP